MNYKSTPFIIVALILSSNFLTGCDQASSSTPTEKILMGSLNGYSDNHGKAYDFLNIKK